MIGCLGRERFFLIPLEDMSNTRRVEIETSITDGGSKGVDNSG